MRSLHVGGRLTRVLRTLGYQLSRHPRPGSIDSLLSGAVVRAGIDLCLDVGAHQGGFGLRLRHDVGFTGKIISFEPSAREYEKLTEVARRDGNWEVHRLGVTDRSGVAQLNISDSESQYNSLHAFTPESRGIVGPYIVHHRIERVTVVTLDDFAAASGAIQNAHALLLKTDTQGNDCRVLRGAERLIGRVAAALVEVNVKPIYQESWLLEDAVGYFRERQFLPAGF